MSLLLCPYLRYTNWIILITLATYRRKKNDIFDAFRLALKFYTFRDNSEYNRLMKKSKSRLRVTTSYLA
jgi:hypothetical protein